MEVYRCLVALPVFKTGEVEYLGLASSIPVHLRTRCAALAAIACPGGEGGARW